MTSISTSLCCETSDAVHRHRNTDLDTLFALETRIGRRIVNETPVTFYCWSAKDDETLTRACLSHLSAAERSKAQQLLNPKDRHRFAQRRALHRWINQSINHQHLPHVPAAMKSNLRSNTGQGSPDQPQLDSPQHAISWTTTGDRCIAAVSEVASMGIDAEVPDRAIDFLSIAKEEFTVIESALIEAPLRVAAGNSEEVAVLDEARELFFRLWRLKEAGLKFFGQGLGQGLASLCFQENNPGELVLLHHPLAWQQDRDLIPTFSEIDIFGLTLAVALPVRDDESLRSPIATATPQAPLERPETKSGQALAARRR